MNILKRLFRGKPQGKNYLNSTSKLRPARAATFTLAGAGTGAAVGVGVGAIAGKRAINSVPFQEVTVDHFEAVTQEELMGYKPPDDYVRGRTKPLDDGIPTEQVFRNNPVYDAAGEPTVAPTSTTFRGRGEPQPVEWRTEEIKHHTMEPDDYSYRAVAKKKRYISHYKTVTKSRRVPSTDFEGNTTYRTEYYTEQEPVYRKKTVGFYQRYTPNIQSRVMGTVEKPVDVKFEHGVDFGSYLIKGALYGAAIGALAGGVAAAMEDRFFPGVLPGG